MNKDYFRGWSPETIEALGRPGMCKDCEDLLDLDASYEDSSGFGRWNPCDQCDAPLCDACYHTCPHCEEKYICNECFHGDQEQQKYLFLGCNTCWEKMREAVQEAALLDLGANI